MTCWFSSCADPRGRACRALSSHHPAQSHAGERPRRAACRSACMRAHEPTGTKGKTTQPSAARQNDCDRPLSMRPYIRAVALSDPRLAYPHLSSCLALLHTRFAAPSSPVAAGTARRPHLPAPAFLVRRGRCRSVSPPAGSGFLVRCPLGVPTCPLACAHPRPGEPCRVRGSVAGPSGPSEGHGVTARAGACRPSGRESGPPAGKRGTPRALPEQGTGRSAQPIA